MDTDLAGRAILVTGASGGIGAEVVRAFVREGARVAAHYHRNSESVNALSRELGGACVPLQADLTAEKDVESLFTRAEEALGPIHVLVANAGIWPPDEVPVIDMTLSQWNGTLAANLTSVFLCARAFFRGIVRHGILDPSAVVVGSTAGIFGEAGHADYAASKSALVYGLLKSLKNEIVHLAPRGRVNAVCPGWVLTPMTRKYLKNAEAARRALQTVPLKKVARAHDVAMTIVYLASNLLSGHVTGQILTVSGGMEGRVLHRPDEVDPSQV